jgi:tyrosine-protein kinase Etk/Wzc
MSEVEEVKEPTLLDYLSVLKKHRRIMGWVIFVTTLSALIYSLVTPKIYQAAGTLLPPMDRRDSMALALDVSKLSQFAGISTPTSTTDIFMSMLKSRTMADAIIDKFDLLKLYKKKDHESARKRLQSDTKITLSKEKMITVSVEATSPQLAADIANYYLEYLDTLNRTVTVTSAHKNKLFIEQRLTETKANLVKLEDLVQNFQTKHKTISIETQAKTAIEAAAQLQAKLTATEIQLQVMQSYLSPDNPDVIKMELQVKEMERQINKLEYGKNSAAGDTASTFNPLNPAFVKMPGLGLDLARLIREVKTQEALYTLLVSQFEQAKIQESRDTPTVVVLDKAVPPERKIKPSIRTNLMLALVASGLLSIFLAFFLEYLQTVKKRSA